MSRATRAAAVGTYDFDLHGVVGVRLLDATPRDLATVERQLGPIRARLTRSPDITVRFVDTATRRPMTYVGVGDTGFNEDGFFVLRGKAGVAGRALLPLDRIGREPELVCERSLPAVPHLLALINLTALAKGVLPLHACAFNLGTTGVLVTGWAKSGKTESLLACAAQGARYVGDEWVYLTGDGQMLGLPEPIRLWAWHLEQLPEVLAGRTAGERRRLRSWRSLAGVARGASTAGLPTASLTRRALPIIERQAYVQVPPTELFGADRMDLRGALDAVVLVLSHTSPDIEVITPAAGEVSGRMLASLADERAPFLAHYRQFRYAFPDRPSSAVESAAERERRLLADLLDSRPAAKVTHPYPCDIAALGEAVMRAVRDLGPGPADTTRPRVVSAS